MIGWEFPPFATGGLGVHCQELTRALNERGDQIDFYMPYTRNEIDAPWMRVVYVKPFPVPLPPGISCEQARQLFSNPHALDGAFAPDWAGAAYCSALPHLRRAPAQQPNDAILRPSSGGKPKPPERTFSNEYGSQFFHTLWEYNCAVVARFSQEHAAHPYDVVHAHDWITFRAGLQIKRLFHIPLVVSVHATEYDRTANLWPADWIVDIERQAIKEADRVIGVSNYTRDQLIHRYHADPYKTRAVYNGIDPARFYHEGDVDDFLTKDRGPMVLYHGRLSVQKGVEFFVKAAKRVIEEEPKTRIVISGNGDLLPKLVEQCIDLGILQHVLFVNPKPGEYDRLKRLYAAADVYVVPSVSEPFGITVLESISAGTPVICSKNCGSAESLGHVLKVDFWDTDEMANKILGVLRHPILGEELADKSKEQLSSFSWPRIAEQTEAIYREVTHR